MLRKVSVPVRLGLLLLTQAYSLISTKFRLQDLFSINLTIYARRAQRQLHNIYSVCHLLKVDLAKLTIYTYSFLGKPDNFRSVAQRLDIPVLGELPLVQGVSMSADGGWPFVLSSPKSVQETMAGVIWKESMMQIASSAVSALDVFENIP